MHLSFKRGHDLYLFGKPSSEIQTLDFPKEINLIPSDFIGLKPKLLKKEGDSVIKGEPIYFNKNDPNVMFTTFFSGKISEIIYGERRTIKKIKILTNSNTEEIEFPSHELVDVKNIDKNKIMEILTLSGLWPCIRRRPFSKIAETNKMPKSIFITTQSTAPFAPNLSVLCDNLNSNALQAGIDALYALTSASINMVMPKQFSNEKIVSLQNVKLHTFEGKHPCGNVGYHIANIDPIKNKEDCVWYVSLQDINSMGTLFLNGVVDEKKIISIGGLSKEKKNKHYFIYKGSLLSDLNVADDCSRYEIISGDALSGKIISMDDSICFYDDTLSFIENEFKREFMGWLNPGFNKYSLSRTFLSSLVPKRIQKLTSAMNGSVRTIVPLGAIEKMCALDVMPTMLLKAIMAEDIEMMEDLGLYECSPEDFSLCSFSDASKMDIMGIVQRGLELIGMEG